MGVVEREERRVGTLAVREPQRHPRMHPDRAGLVGRAGDDLARLGRVAGAADDHGDAHQIGAAQTLDRDLELVEIHVQHPHPSECAP